MVVGNLKLNLCRCLLMNDKKRANPDQYANTFLFPFVRECRHMFGHGKRSIELLVSVGIQSIF